MTIRIHLAPAQTWPILIALAAGALNVLAFAPFGFWPLQIAMLALVFWLVARQSSVKRSTLIGWAYGFGWIVACVHWLYISMHRYGGLPGWMAVLAVVLFGLVTGAFAAFAMGGTTWLKQRWSVSTTAVSLLLLPAMWALAEWARGWVLTGFPWASSGYAHTNGPLAGFAPVIGVYGLAWVSAMIAACLALLPSN